MSDVTQILSAIERGDAKASDELLPLVYEELRRLAAYKMASESPDQTLQPTALVHEAWLRLTGNKELNWNGRTHFFAASAEAMRRILIDNARRKLALRHGGGQQRVEILEQNIAASADDEQLLDLNEALDKLASKDKQKAELVKLRFFVGLTIEESADILGISVATAKRHWIYARAWLQTEMAADKKP
jgi:RNA polymerase sigma factor (TIGR02999 family)